MIAATLIGASPMMRVETDDQILGYPAIAMAFFSFAVCAGVAHAVWIVATDRKAASVVRRESAG